MKDHSSSVSLTDRDLIAEVKRLAADERRSTASLVAVLVEFDARRLYLGEGCRSLFTYCTEVLRLSEHAAYGRIEAARAARRFPYVLELLSCGDVTLTTITLLAPHLTEDHHRETLQSARHKSKREVERLVATLHPQPDAPAVVRRLPQAVVMRPAPTAVTRPPASELSSPLLTAEPATPTPSQVVRVKAPRPAVIEPLAPERYKMQFTVSREAHDRFRRAQDLLRHVVPNGEPAVVFDRAITLLVAHLEKEKLAAVPRRQTTSSCVAARTISSSRNR